VVGRVDTHMHAHPYLLGIVALYLR